MAVRVSAGFTRPAPRQLQGTHDNMSPPLPEWRWKLIFHCELRMPVNTSFPSLAASQASSPRQHGWGDNADTSQRHTHASLPRLPPLQPRGWCRPARQAPTPPGGLEGSTPILGLPGQQGGSGALALSLRPSPGSPFAPCCPARPWAESGRACRPGCRRRVCAGGHAARCPPPPRRERGDASIG